MKLNLGENIRFHALPHFWKIIAEMWSIVEEKTHAP